MDMQLFHDTVRMLEHEIGHDVFNRIQMNDELVIEMINILQAYQLTQARKKVILGSFMMLYTAVRKHRVTQINNNKEITKNILDGDYLMGTYFQLLMQQNETELIRYLIPAHKKMQIDLIEGKQIEDIWIGWMKQFKAFLHNLSTAGGEVNEIA
jgi:hypothetical protein